MECPLNASITALDVRWAGCPALTLWGPNFVNPIAETMLRGVALARDPAVREVDVSVNVETQSSV